MNWGKESLLGAGVLSLANTVWGTLLALVTIPIMINGLGLTYYGIYTLAFSMAGFGVFLDLGLGWTISRFVAEADALKNQGLLVTTVRVGVFCHLVIAFLFVVIVYPSAGWIAQAILRTSAAETPVMVNVLRIAVVSFACSSIGSVFICTLRGLRRFAPATLISVIGVTISVVGAAAMARLGMGVVPAAVAQLAGALICVAMGAWVCRPYLPRPDGEVAIRKQLRRMVEFSFWTYMYRLIQMFVLHADKVLIGRFSGPAFLPIYTVPFGFAQKINFIAGPAVTAIYPTAAADQNDPEMFIRKYFSGARLVHILTGAAALSVLLWGEKFLTAWIGAEFASRSVFYLNVFTVGYWVISVGSFDLVCIEGWNRPRTAFIIAGIGMLSAICVGFIVWPIIGVSRAIALSVATWLVTVGVGGMITWQRISRYPIQNIFRQIVLPLGEMALIGYVLSSVSRYVAGHRFVVIAVLPMIAVVLTIHGCIRAFSREELRTIFSRLASFVGR
jgi:O-antigen/teichoic acid export membrane protein